MRRGESRLPAATAVLAALVLQAVLSEQLVPGPRLVLPGLELALLLGLVAADPSRLTEQSRDLRVLSIGLVTVVGVVNAYALVNLVDRLVYGHGTGRALLSAAAG
ncbi:MAG: hypothetical protein ACXV4A_11080, partial [Actinomycetes bacterium]